MEIRGGRKIRPLLVLFALVLVLTAWAQIREVSYVKKANQKSRFAAYEKKPDLKAWTVDGKQASLEAYRGQWVLISFWGSWCPPCRKELPELDAMVAGWNANPAHSKKISFLALNTTEPPHVAKSYWEAQNFKVGILLTSDQAEQERWGVESFPTVFLLDLEGAVRFNTSGYRKGLGQEIAQMIEAREKPKP